MKPPQIPLVLAAMFAVLTMRAVPAARGPDHGSDWPCFQGPGGNGSSPETGLLHVSLTVDRMPTWVGVDPYNKRIDRNSDDNLTKVEAK